MAGLIRTLFKSKKNRKEEENDDDYAVFQPCVQSSSLKRQPTARFADDCMLSATAAYHTTSAPKLRKGPQSCPGGARDDFIDEIPEYFAKRSGRRRKDSKRQDFRIDTESDSSEGKRARQSQQKQYSSMNHGRSHQSLRPETDEDRVSMFEEKSQYYMRKWEESERQRKDEKRKQEHMERERNNIQNAMSNIAYCMASVQQLEQLKKERDQYKKEMSRLRNKCEKLESKCEQLEAKPPNYYQSFQNPSHHPSPFQTPQFPAPHSFTYPISLPQQHHHSTQMNSNFINMQHTGPLSTHYPPGSFHNFTMSHTPTTIGSDGAGESLANPSDISFLRNSSNKKAYYDDEEDEIKNYRDEDGFMVPTPFSEITQSTNTTCDL